MMRAQFRRLAPIVGCCLLFVLPACANEPEERVIHPEGYSYSADQPTTIMLHLTIGRDDRVKTASVVRETEQEVAVKVIVSRPGGPVGARTLDGVATTVDLTLESPLGQQTVKDETTDETIPLVQNERP